MKFKPITYEKLMAIKLKYQPASTPPLGEMPIEIHCIQARFD